MRKYPSGSRGSPAKGVALLKVARVQIPPSAPKNRTDIKSVLFFVSSNSVNPVLFIFNVLT